MLASITLTSVASMAPVRSPTRTRKHVGAALEIAIARAVADVSEMRIAGKGPKLVASVAASAAPVGVVSSTSGPRA